MKRPTSTLNTHSLVSFTLIIHHEESSSQRSYNPSLLLRNYSGDTITATKYTRAMPDQPQPTPIVYDNDTRYPGPLVHPPPGYIKGIPTQAELDAQARMFTWGELKEIISMLTR
jgi:hypothetical protein